jgi:hypothetical protein
MIPTLTLSYLLEASIIPLFKVRSKYGPGGLADKTGREEAKKYGIWRG